MAEDEVCGGEIGIGGLLPSFQRSYIEIPLAQPILKNEPSHYRAKQCAGKRGCAEKMLSGRDRTKKKQRAKSIDSLMSSWKWGLSSREGAWEKVFLGKKCYRKCCMAK